MRSSVHLFCLFAFATTDNLIESNKLEFSYTDNFNPAMIPLIFLLPLRSTSALPVIVRGEKKKYR